MTNPHTITSEQALERIHRTVVALEEMAGRLETMAESLQADYTFTAPSDFTPATIGLSALSTEVASARHRLLGAILEGRTALLRSQLREDRLGEDERRLNTRESTLRARATALDEQEKLLDGRAAALSASILAVEAREGLLARLAPSEAQDAS